VATVEKLLTLIRANRAAQLAARRGRSRARGLRAKLRAARLAGRTLVTECGELRSVLEAQRLIHRVAKAATQSSERA